MFLVVILTVHYTQGQVDFKILYTNTYRIILKKFLICKKGIHHMHHYLTKISSQVQL